MIGFPKISLKQQSICVTEQGFESSNTTKASQQVSRRHLLELHIKPEQETQRIKSITKAYILYMENVEGCACHILYIQSSVTRRRHVQIRCGLI